MKSLKEMVNEARGIEYRVMLNDVFDKDDMPISVSIVVDRANQREFEDWLEEQEGDLFGHAEGGNVEY